MITSVWKYVEGVVVSITSMVLYLVAALDGLHQSAHKLLCHVHDIVVVSVCLQQHPTRLGKRGKTDLPVFCSSIGRAVLAASFLGKSDNASAQSKSNTMPACMPDVGYCHM